MNTNDNSTHSKVDQNGAGNVVMRDGNANTGPGQQGDTAAPGSQKSWITIIVAVIGAIAVVAAAYIGLYKK